MAFVAYITGPFVTYIHLRLPAFARHSREMLHRYARSLPKDAELDFTGMNFIGKPRVTRVKFSELQAAKERFGMVNYARDTRELNTQRRRWVGKATRQFGVHGGTTRIMGGEIWDLIAKRIAKP